ncbi:MAG: hypothetical protein HKM95_15635 [Inquilinus sp.]|nr:hypothetical protein [Inquilinus sp.]
MIRLPLIDTVSRGYAFAFRHILLLARIGWIWFVAAHAAVIAAPVLATRMGGMQLAFAGPLVMALAGAAIVVAWHRVVASHGEARRVARLGRRELRYLGFVLALLGILYVPVVAMTMIADAGGGRPSPALIWPLAGAMLIVIVSICRLILIFPGIALERRVMTLSRSWALTRGNAWCLFIGGVMCAGPLLVLGAGLGAASEILLAREAAWWLGHGSALLGSLALFLQFAVVGGYLSFVFEHFAAQPLPAESTRSAPPSAVTA